MNANTSSTCSSYGYIYGSYGSRDGHKVGPYKYSTGSLSTCASYNVSLLKHTLLSCVLPGSGK